MKNNQEIIDWFNNYFYNCYYVTHDNFPETIFMFYDKNYIRQHKLAKLEGKDYVEKSDITGVCLFQQDWKNKWFRCNYDLIWCYFRDNYSTIYSDFKSFITDRLEEHSKMSILSPKRQLTQWQKVLEEHSKMSILSPHCCFDCVEKVLEEHSKMSILSPRIFGLAFVIILEEHSKMSILSPSKMNVCIEEKLEEHSKMSINL